MLTTDAEPSSAIRGISARQRAHATHELISNDRAQRSSVSSSNGAESRQPEVIDQNVRRSAEAFEHVKDREAHALGGR